MVDIKEDCRFNYSNYSINIVNPLALPYLSKFDKYLQKEIVTKYFLMNALSGINVLNLEIITYKGEAINLP